MGSIFIKGKTMKTLEKNNYEKGVDVSKWQGNIKWNEVINDGIKHAFIKMTEGGTYTDPQFVANWNAAKKTGISVGAYHYFRGASSTPEEQTENIRKNLTSIAFDTTKDWLAIDVEKRGNESVTPDAMADNLQNLLTRIKRDVLPNFDVIIYCSSGYWDSGVNWKKYDFSVHRLWVAHWNVEKPRLPKTWDKPGTTWFWWQHSSKGHVQGIQGEVDLDWVNTPSTNSYCSIL
ncbi:glycosyl hydrolase, family 25 [Rickettsiella grylli]|uniref:Lysozyme n=2 Tax=Rickettsiella grylli TaxID=59196 RepID=A8PLV5_9COXI|nr:glycosyl hydrolase, family 25 [Rickettsiella grylli]